MCPLDPRADLGFLSGPVPSWLVHLDASSLYCAQVFWWSETFPMYSTGAWGSVFQGAWGPWYERLQPPGVTLAKLLVAPCDPQAERERGGCQTLVSAGKEMGWVEMH